MNDKHTLFITNISTKVTKHILYELLIQISPLNNVYYNTDNGYAFVDYQSNADMEYALKALENTKLFGKKIYLHNANDRTVLKISNLTDRMDKEYIHDIFRKFGKCTVRLEGGYGLITYMKNDAALQALSKVNKRRLDNTIVDVCAVEGRQYGCEK